MQVFVTTSNILNIVGRLEFVRNQDNFSLNKVAIWWIIIISYLMYSKIHLIIISKKWFPDIMIHLAGALLYSKSIGG